MGGQMYSHRSKEYLGLHYDTVERLQDFLETENDIYLFSSTGTGFMEASVLNCVREKMLVCVNGSFGKRFADVGRAHGREVAVLEPPLGQPVTPGMLEEALSEDPGVEAVAITHNETSVGLINPLEKLAKVTKAHGKLLFVDAVSSMGGTELKVDNWGIDICFSSSQKCFGVPPGLGIGSVSREALEMSEEAVNKGWYFDLKIWERYHKQGRGTPMTSAIPQVAGMNAALRMIEERGGKGLYFDLYNRRNGKIRGSVERLSLSIFPDEGFESPTVSCINAPGGVGGPAVYEAMRREGFELAQGYGVLKKKTFRIGNMGYMPEEDIDLMLDALGKVL
ncbi:MAG: alanine--glyoxylate aminotransferase family protein [Candidatus Bathyarchaeota archaeon]|nr:MAG: alanine--glyoxylate aminotransferase family protein [Candidatus Bathyarchaeota archaeon]